MICAGLFDGGPADRQPEDPAGNRTRLQVRCGGAFLRLRKMPAFALLSGNKSDVRANLLCREVVGSTETAGTGVLRFTVPRWLPPFRSGLEFIGHSGISGTVAFVCPASGRIIVGTVNQLQDKGRPYRMMMKAGMA